MCGLTLALLKQPQALPKTDRRNGDDNTENKARACGQHPSCCRFIAFHQATDSSSKETEYHADSGQTDYKKAYKRSWVEVSEDCWHQKRGSMARSHVTRRIFRPL